MDHETKTEAVGGDASPAMEQSRSLNLSDEQRARVTERLMELARGVSRALPITMLPEGPHSSHGDNDGWF